MVYGCGMQSIGRLLLSYFQAFFSTLCDNMLVWCVAVCKVLRHELLMGVGPGGSGEVHWEISTLYQPQTIYHQLHQQHRHQHHRQHHRHLHKGEGLHRYEHIYQPQIIYHQ